MNFEVFYSKFFSNKKNSSPVGDIVDTFTTWLRSSMTYVWAKDLEEFYEKAIIWVQTNAGFVEWTPHGKVRK